jgi:protein-tyrosine phosphatase
LSATSVLFVCLGNICRSPTAEGLVRHHLRLAGLDGQVRVDSAGTGGWHQGEPPDSRAVAAAARRGVAIGDLRARQVTPADFERFDLILGMDRQNVQNLRRLAGGRAQGGIALFLQEALGETADVPDPYYEDDAAFDRVFDLCDRAARALVARLGPPSTADAVRGHAARG